MMDRNAPGYLADSSDAPVIDKPLIAESFSRAANSYDAAAVFQRLAGERLLERLQWVTLKPANILDLGCGTGHFTRKLKKHYRRAKVTGLDLAPGMIEHAKKQNTLMCRPQYQVGDAEALPFPDGQFDLIFSNLTVQWIGDLDALFREAQRVLKPGGLMLFTTLGPDTLFELKQSWRAADSKTHVNEFIDMHDVGDAMLRARFADPVMDCERITMTYKTVNGLMKDLKDIGAHNVNPDRPRGMATRSAFKSMRAAYEEFRDDDGALPATYELIYGHAWATDLAPKRGYHEYAVDPDRTQESEPNS